MASTPHFLKIVRALALVGGGALAACSGPMSVNDAATDGAATSETSAPDASVQPDASSPDATTGDTGVSVDTGVGSDVVAPADTGVGADARADVGVDAGADALADVASDGNACPEAPPMNAAACAMNGQSCMYTGAGGEFTQCTCASGAWMCFTAVPGPLPPPELMA